MEALENFFKSEACIPVIMVLMLVLLGVVVWTTISNKKAHEQMRAKQRQNIDESAEIKIVAQEPVIEEPKEEIIPENLPLVDIPINIMDETEVAIEPVKKVEEVMEEQINIPLIPAFQEVPVAEEEKVKLEFSQPLDSSLDIGEKVEIPVPTPIIEEKEEQAISIAEIEGSNIEPVIEKVEEPAVVEEQIEVAENVSETNQAFGVAPTEDTTINENVVIEEPKEYDGNKTEIFDFPDFSEISGDKQTSNNIDVDEEILKTAHQYINSVMSK